MAKSDKVYWIGDDGDNKSVSIARKVYSRGDEIPAADVATDMLKKWEDQDLISVGEKRAPIVITNKDAVKNLEAEIRSLKADLDSLPALKRKNEELEAALEKAKSGKKADAVKNLEAAIAAKDEEISDLSAKITALDLDVQEKAALIDKLNSEIEQMTKPGGGA